MRYVSTRGNSEKLGFSDVMLKGLAYDGGLYVPEFWPRLSQNTIAGFVGERFQNVAKTILHPFIGDEISEADLSAIIEDAYAGFHHPAITPLVQTDYNCWVMELFHGPTMAFKDIAMQLLARFMERELKKHNTYSTIICATSGDTGAAAAEAFGACNNIDLFVLFPEGKISPIQQRQITTTGKKQIHALSVKGNFDDCQNLVKAMFNHQEFRKDMNLSGVNSINWARILAQTVYYFTAGCSLGAPYRPVSFTVPTGNFGDIFAGLVAKKMGLPIDKLVIATNENDILVRALTTGKYRVKTVKATTSPSMDIQVSSNFERLLFEANDRNGALTKEQMTSLGEKGNFQIKQTALEKILQDFSAGTCDENMTSQTIQSMFSNCNYLVDPHTAVALKVAKENKQKDIPMIVFSTAHPSKFPNAIKNAANIIPTLPTWHKSLMEREEKFTSIINNFDMLESHIRNCTSVKRKIL